MAGREQPYDPYIPSGSSGQGGNGHYEGGNQRTAAIQSPSPVLRDVKSTKWGSIVFRALARSERKGMNIKPASQPARRAVKKPIAEFWHQVSRHPARTFISIQPIANLPNHEANVSFPLSQQIDDTVNVMKKNLESVAQRGENIDQLQDKSENLNQSAQGFRRGANRVRKQMWWKNMKMRIWIIVGIIVLLLIIIIPSVVAAKH